MGPLHPRRPLTAHSTDDRIKKHALVRIPRRAIDPAWIATRVGFVTTMVDRITPRPTDEDRTDLLARSGVDDPACVVTEPYSEWLLRGDLD